MRKGFFFFTLLLCIFQFQIYAATTKVCSTCNVKNIGKAIELAAPGDTIQIEKGIYKEWDIKLDKPLTIIGKNNPVIDVNNKGYGLIFGADSITVIGLTIRNIGQSYTKDYAAIHLHKNKNFIISNCVLENVFFGILCEKSNNGLIEKNTVSSNAVREASSGNGVHLWHSNNVTIRNNELHHLRDGIYFEFATDCSIENNYSHNNLRYGLHFMFSHGNLYKENVFTQNGAGVAVMFSKEITMLNNKFLDNMGAASYGLLLKEINDSKIEANLFNKNTIGIFIEGSNRVEYRKNIFSENGWAIKVAGACYSNSFLNNDFLNNSFDVSYNSQVNDNRFNHNYWSEYSGYDLNNDGLGDVAYRPVKLFSYVVNNTPETIILLRSLFVMILNFSEKITPIFTPDNLVDEHPQMIKNCDSNS
ncbi:MAG: nitrous oxide reductase family maturation protein NosD [Flavobacteriales bacterium]|nr:nitrous oxide reductase family maturation protein NosD [Flavobacteriales bacterium]